MPRHTRFVFLLLSLLLAFDGIRPTHALGVNSRRVELFARGKSTVPFEQDDGEVVPRVAHSFRIPSLVEVDGVLVAIGDARYLSDDDNAFIETAVKFSVDGGSTWETQIAIKNSRVNSERSRVLDPTVIVKGNKIYVLVGSYNITSTYWTWQGDGSDWEPLLAVGEVNKTTVGGKPNATITWGKPVSLKSIFPKTIAGAPSAQFLGGVSRAIVLNDKTLVFPVQATNEKKQITSMIMYSDDDGASWSFGSGNTHIGCSEPSLVEWEGKLIMNARVDNAPRKVFESTDMGETWSEAVGTLSRVWGPSPSRTEPGSQGSFITVTIEGVRVMLFTVPLNFKGRWLRDRLHLWVTDNRRIFDVGQVSDGDEDSPYSSLLYTKAGKLYCLHEMSHDRVYSLIFAELIDELELVRSVVRTWKAQDEYFSKTCSSTASEALPSDGGCAAAVPTGGLVGFLSGNSDDHHWQDVYRCVDANVTGAEKVTNGLLFKGHGAGALWPVNLQGQNRRYEFMNNAFTLVATVTIREAPACEKNPLLGVSMTVGGGKRVLGLSYGKNYQWRPVYGGVLMNAEETWELNKPYQVAITMGADTSSVYVDGKVLGGAAQPLPPALKVRDFSHIYIGGLADGSKGPSSSVTVANVLLYNRVLSPHEVETLSLYKDSIAVAPDARLEAPSPFAIPGAETAVMPKTDGGASPLPQVPQSPPDAVPRATSETVTPAVNHGGGRRENEDDGPLAEVIQCPEADREESSLDSTVDVDASRSDEYDAAQAHARMLLLLLLGVWGLAALY
ncbi:hypothetical protein DQ04_05261000 [Trypanosoma grayi]|uniref:hypothetical protein n=1 Tax=Trypanosoma grayi TaxID=71804 RepID=UPI0004F47A1F|nr:hypothetical protein DQ04_05261000 [Trypanosoma grayi]KEG09408.1 hypothetical protein DQ04_05261000 [Trypanosoma grayi]